VGVGLMISYHFSLLVCHLYGEYVKEGATIYYTQIIQLVYTILQANFIVAILNWYYFFLLVLIHSLPRKK
jgi:hypothetical protein